jgi:hypothetical protein
MAGMNLDALVGLAELERELAWFREFNSHGGNWETHAAEEAMERNLDRLRKELECS